jgi:predicted small lipoprotein YifL
MKATPMKAGLAIAAIALVLLVSACGNKGPLVRPSDVPPPADSGS